MGFNPPRGKVLSQEDFLRGLLRQVISRLAEAQDPQKALWISNKESKRLLRKAKALLKRLAALHKERKAEECFEKDKEIKEYILFCTSKSFCCKARCKVPKAKGHGTRVPEIGSGLNSQRIVTDRSNIRETKDLMPHPGNVPTKKNG